MRRLGSTASTLVVLGALHLHLHRPGSGADYVGVLLASVASWVGLPGPGEAALIAAGISAAHHHLDLSTVIAVAWAGATMGGAAGWLVGLKGGRALVTAPGPLQRLRLRMLTRGNPFSAPPGGLLAVLFTPSWVAGIHQMRWSRFLPADAVSSLIWAVGIGLGAYLVGPSITEIVADAGLAGGLLVVLIFAVGVTVTVVRRRRRRRRAH